MSNKSWGEAKLMVYVGNVCSDVLTPMKAPPAIASKRGKVVLWCFWSVSVGPKLSSIIHDISIATRSYYDAWLQRKSLIRRTGTGKKNRNQREKKERKSR